MRDENGIEVRYIEDISKELGIGYEYCYGIVRDIFYYYSYCLRVLKYKFIRIDGFCRIRPNIRKVYDNYKIYEDEELGNVWKKLQDRYRVKTEYIENALWVKKGLSLMVLPKFDVNDIVRYSARDSIETGIVKDVYRVRLLIRRFSDNNIVCIKKSRCIKYG